MAWEKVASGQKIRQTPIHRAGFINDTIDVVNAHKEGRLQRGSDALQGSQSRVQVEVRNLTGSDLGRGQLVQLGAHLLTNVSEEHPWFEGNVVADPVASKFAILNRPIKAGQIGPAQVAGVCLAYVFVLDTAHKHAVPSAGATVLISSKVGTVEFLMLPPGLGLRHVWVKLDHKENYCYHVTLGTGIGAGASGTVTLPDNSTVTAVNWSADTALLPGDRCLCFKDLVDNTYYLIKTGGQPQTKIWHSTANVNIAAGASGNVTLSTGAVVSATNWSNEVDISASDKIHVYQDPTDSAYYAIKSARGGTRWFKANLTGTLESPDANASVGNVVALDGGSVPAITTASNWLKKAGTNGSVVAIVEDRSGPSPDYLLMDVVHKEVSVDIAVEVDDPDDPTVLRQWKRTLCVMTGNDDSNVEDIVTLEDVAVDTNVKVDSPGNPTKLQQTKRTIKSFPKPDDTADSDIIGIESC